MLWNSTLKVRELSSLLPCTLPCSEYNDSKFLKHPTVAHFVFTIVLQQPDRDRIIMDFCLEGGKHMRVAWLQLTIAFDNACHEPRSWDEPDTRPNQKAENYVAILNDAFQRG